MSRFREIRQPMLMSYAKLRHFVQPRTYLVGRSEVWFDDDDNSSNNSVVLSGE
jgi:hypothetical protein